MTYYCAICNYSTDFPSNFNRHNTSSRHLKLVAGESTRKTYKCPIKNCRYKTMHASNYKRHEDMHKGIHTYIYKCALCDYKIRDMEALGTHLRSKRHRNNLQRHREYLKPVSLDRDNNKIGMYILTPDGKNTDVYKELMRFRRRQLKNKQSKKYSETESDTESDTESESETESETDTETDTDSESEEEIIPYLYKKDFKKYYDLTDDQMIALLKKAYKWAEYNADYHKNNDYLSRIFNPKKGIVQIYDLSREKVLYLDDDERAPEESCAITPLKRLYMIVSEIVHNPNKINDGYDEDDGDEMLKPKFIR